MEIICRYSCTFYFVVWAKKKKTFAKASKAPLFIPNVLYGEMSEYEKAREENIKVSPPPPLL